MEKIEYERLNRRERYHWWNIGRQKILEENLKIFLENKTGNLEILDVGCGAGGNIVFLKKFGSVSGFDISEEAMKFSKNKDFKELVVGDAENIPLENQSYDVISSLDVIEHIKDDRKALKEIFRVLRNKGTLILTVPAHRWLWSMHDEAMHHYRRYSNTEIKKKVSETGFKIIKQSHFVIPAIPFLLLKKLLRQIKKEFNTSQKEKIDTYDVDLPNFLNNLFIFWLFLEKFFMRYISIPFGSSIIIVAKKNERVP